MRSRLFVTAAVAAAFSVQSAHGQAVTYAHVDEVKPAPVAQKPAATDDTPEEIAEDAARDLKDSRFYNKPGATRAQYDADWQDCRLIARGSRTPGGMIPVYYNPQIISPVVAGAGGLVGGLIGSAISQGKQRRANRRACLLIKGWRLIEVPSDTAAKVGAMTDAQREAYFNSIVGAQQVMGGITERTSFTVGPDRKLKLDAPLTGPGTLYLGKKVDPKVPVAVTPGEATIVFGFRRPDEGSARNPGAVSINRYDMKLRDLAYRPSDWKKTGDTTTYSLTAKSKDKKALYEVQVLRITPGDYVFSSSHAGNLPSSNSYCFGAPVFHVEAGETLYVGDFFPYANVGLADGSWLTGVAWASHIEDARGVLAPNQAALAAALKPAPFNDRATYSCGAVSMDRWDLPGVEDLPELPPQPAPAVATPATR